MFPLPSLARPQARSPPAPSISVLGLGKCFARGFGALSNARVRSFAAASFTSARANLKSATATADNLTARQAFTICASMGSEKLGFTSRIAK